MDGGSTDDTLKIAEQSKVSYVKVGHASRPKQLNEGAKLAKSDALFFVHADTLPPKDYDLQLLDAIHKGASFGSFRLKFNENNGMLKLNSYCSRFPLMLFRGGDQTLFIKKSLFEQLNGYDENKIIMEDYDIITRAKKHEDFTLLQDDVIVSARKYIENSYFRVNWANFIIFSMYYCGVETDKLARLYPKLIRHPKSAC